MHYFKELNSSLHALDSLDYVYLLPAGCVEVTEQEYTDLVAEKNTPTLELLWEEYQSKAKSLLDATDIVALRCWKAGVVYPTEWQIYTINLRAIVSAKSGDPTAELPPIPKYPAGT